jgi:2-keto-4-pentenoate hydratase/2-oxohepta-3-ene-1,7-dioic acid hydratase in catechol pathway
VLQAGPDGPEARIVVASTAVPGELCDVRTAARLALERRGASPAAAARISAATVPAGLTAAIEAGELFLEAARGAEQDSSGDARASAEAPLASPVDPPSYRDFMAFEQHVLRSHQLRNATVPEVYYELPVSYMGSVQAIIGPEATVPWPAYTERMDYELELGLVIGRPGRDLLPEQSLDHVLGLTVLNDFSARDIQRREMSGGLGPSKGKHFATAVGPHVVTLDELAIDDLPMTARVNGELWSEGNSGTIMWSLAELVAWASAGETLAAGSLLGSGTVGGGCGSELERRLAPGDAVELEIQGIGVLRNRLGQPSENGWAPAPRAPARS